jgi:hypothetical protein
MGQMEMKCIFNIGKNISILAKVTKVSDVAHGPLVQGICIRCDFCSFFPPFFVGFPLTFYRSFVLPELSKLENINIRIIYLKIRLTNTNVFMKMFRKFQDH